MNNKRKEAVMYCWLKGIILGILMLVLSVAAFAQEISREQIKGLDEQVQEIKSDVLSIATELNQLEEKLLYPSNTQVAVFVSLVSGETFRLDSVEIQLDGKPVAHHIYTFKELEALQKGGVQRIYTGNIRSGDHDLEVSVIGKSSGGGDLQKTNRFKVNKDVGPKIVEISLASQSITLKDR
jgi:predicted dinucleotide-utilizing enzyme